MKLALVFLVLASSLGCAIKRPIRAMYCEVRKPDGTCQTWAYGKLGPSQPMGGRGPVADE